MPEVVPTCARRRAPVLRQGSSQSSITSSVAEDYSAGPSAGVDATEAAPAAPTHNTRRAPVLRQGSSSQSILGALPPELPDESEQADERVADDDGTIVALDGGGAGGATGLLLLQRRWRTARRVEHERARAAAAAGVRAEAAKGGRRRDAGDDTCLVACCACLVIATVVVLWIGFVSGAILYGLMWMKNATMAEMLDDLHRVRAVNLGHAG